jgi:EpsD family peptidyl-prolyl cis-trans isomerase
MASATMSSTAISCGHGRIAAIACAAMAIALSACGKTEVAGDVVGQVIAHVGSDDVTQQELDNELRHSNVSLDKPSDLQIRSALGRVVERKFFAQRAIAMKLDREPTLSLDLLRGRELVLADTYAQRDLAAKASGISTSEVEDYIQAHPAQFTNRQQFQIEQVSFPLQHDMNGIMAAVKELSSLDQVGAKLNELGVKFDRGTGMLDSATLLPELLSRLEARKPDDIFLIRSGTGFAIFKVISVSEKPPTDDEANRFAKQQMLADLARKTDRETRDASLASARYEGDYSRIMGTLAPTAQAPSEERQQPH